MYPFQISVIDSSLQLFSTLLENLGINISEWILISYTLQCVHKCVLCCYKHNFKVKVELEIILNVIRNFAGNACKMKSQTSLKYPLIQVSMK